MTIAQIDLTYLAELMTRCAGVPTTAAKLADDPSFDDLGVDSLGLLGIITEVENELSVSLPEAAQTAQRPSELIGLVAGGVNRRS